MKPDHAAPCADQALAAASARLLAACATTTGALGLGCAALAAGALLLQAPTAPAALLLAVLALAPVERVLALRLRFDAGLFADLASRPGAQPTELAALDRALHALRLRPVPSAPRPLADRVRGAQRLLAWHAVCGALQFAGLLTACTSATWTAR